MILLPNPDSEDVLIELNALPSALFTPELILDTEDVTPEREEVIFLPIPENEFDSVLDTLLPNEENSLVAELNGDLKLFPMLELADLNWLSTLFSSDVIFEAVPENSFLIPNVAYILSTSCPSAIENTPMCF